MDERKENTKTASEWIDPDDAPDLSTPYWVKKFAAASVKRGRPVTPNPKISTTIRLDSDVLAFFKAEGRGWQTRVNAALRKAAGLTPPSDR